jgi:hypothetical protein
MTSALCWARSAGVLLMDAAAAFVRLSAFRPVCALAYIQQLQIQQLQIIKPG